MAGDSWIGEHGTPGDGPPDWHGHEFKHAPRRFRNLHSPASRPATWIKTPIYDVWSINQNNTLSNDYSDVLH